MLPARAAGLHLEGGVRIPDIAAVTEESAAARSALPEGRASRGQGPPVLGAGLPWAPGDREEQALGGDTFPPGPHR